MSVIGSVVGFQEGMEGGLVGGGLALGEESFVKPVAVCGGAIVAGVAFGHFAGESALSVTDRFVGDGGIGFVPAAAIGASVWWHNVRAANPRQTRLGEWVSQRVSSLPYVAAAAFAGFEGVEAGILTSSAHTGLLTSEVVTVGAAGATVVAMSAVKALAKKFSPDNALRVARGVALAPAIYLGAKAAPELYADPKAAGVGVAVLGSVATAGAIGSFFKRSDKNKA